MLHAYQDICFHMYPVFSKTTWMYHVILHNAVNLKRNNSFCCIGNPCIWPSLLLLGFDSIVHPNPKGFPLNSRQELEIKILGRPKLKLHLANRNALDLILDSETSRDVFSRWLKVEANGFVSKFDRLKHCWSEILPPWDLAFFVKYAFKGVRNTRKGVWISFLDLKTFATQNLKQEK